VNGSLRQDNSELQQLLGDAREEFTSLQEEYEEYKSNPLVALSGGECSKVIVYFLVHL